MLTLPEASTASTSWRSTCASAALAAVGPASRRARADAAMARRVGAVREKPEAARIGMVSRCGGHRPDTSRNSHLLEWRLSAAQQRTGAVVGQQFEQHGMFGLAVEDDDALDAGFERVDAGLHFRDHAARYGAVGDQRAGFVKRELLDEVLRLVEHARHVGEQQQPL